MNKKCKKKIMKRLIKMLVNLIGLLLIGGMFSYLIIEYLTKFTY